MSIADLFDEIVSAARRKTASATEIYDHRMAVLGDRVRVRAADDRHRRGVTRDSIARGGAILLPADDIDLSPHSPLPDSAPKPDLAAVPDPAPVRNPADGVAAGPVADTGTSGPTGSPDPDSSDPDASYANGWLTDR